MNEQVQGQETDTSAGSDFNATSFIAQQLINLISTAKVVKVISCTNDGGIEPVGFVDVQPLVAQIDGEGKIVPHGIVHNLPYARLQGGQNAIIIDPMPGDIGVAVFADRDISVVKSTRGAGQPGSFRKYAIADGIYLGMILNAAPEQYVQFIGNEINVHSPGNVNIATDGDTTITTGGQVEITSTGVTHITASGGCTIDADTVNNGAFTVNGHTTLNGPISQGSGSGGTAASLIGPLAVTNDVTANGKSVDSHTHGGVQPGGSNTNPPN